MAAAGGRARIPESSIAEATAAETPAKSNFAALAINFHPTNQYDAEVLFCVNSLTDMVTQCKNRVLLFDNHTKYNHKRDARLKQLLHLVDSVISSNYGKPFSNLMFNHMKKAHDKLKEFNNAEVEGKLNNTIETMQKQINKKTRHEPCALLNNL
ncbi:hypothetical protein EJB05_37841, partial [Eragrostis curvula]